MKKQRIWPVLVVAGIGFCILCGLGVWQVKRLAWKEGLIAKLEARISLPPVPIEEALVKLATGEDVEYLKVHVRTYPQVQKTLRKQTSFQGQPAWQHITRVQLMNRDWLLLDLGIGKADRSMQFVPLDFDAILRKHDGGRGRFDVENDIVGNNWFWWDLPAMQKALNVDRGKPIVLQLTNAVGMENYFVQQPKAELRNNHLGYAITWFGLAAALVGVTGAFIWRSTRS